MPCLDPRLCIQMSNGAQPRISRNRVGLLKEFGTHDRIALHFHAFSAFDVPCGQCLQCRLSQSRNWAVRCQHELQMHPEGGIFLTLTYAPEHYPENLSLDKTAVPRFIADLRRQIGKKIKYYHCGEYGDKLGRAHYHVLIFGWKPPRDTIRQVRGGTFPLFTSTLIECLWGKGHCPFGELTFESAAYTARYATKKITGRKADSHYRRAHPDTGEIFQVIPEYATMSNRGGIGRSWLEKHFKEVYPADSVLVNGHLVQPPRFYDKIAILKDPEMFKEVKLNRLQKYANKAILSVDQLADLRRATQSRFDLLMRNIE